MVPEIPVAIVIFCNITLNYNQVQELLCIIIDKF